MSQHIISICKSCNAVHSQEVDYEKAEGRTLLNELTISHQNSTQKDDLEIRSVSCMWTCKHPCAVAFSATNKPTYLFTKVPPSEADAILKFGELYLKNKTGDVPWKKFPESLQSLPVAKIPPVSQRINNAEQPVEANDD